MSARDQAGVDGVLGLASHHHQAFVGHDDRDQSGLNPFHGRAQDGLEFITPAVVAGGVAGAHGQQHVQVAFLFGQRTVQGLNLFRFISSRVKFQRRTHQGIHECRALI
jgi:hypothetical protein